MLNPTPSSPSPRRVSAGAKDVVVTNTDSQTSTLTGGYTYTGGAPAPTVTSVSPVTGSTAGHRGDHHRHQLRLALPTVTFGGTAATVVFGSATSLTATTAATRPAWSTWW